MSKVYDYYMAMEELSNDAEYQEYLAEIEMKQKEEMNQEYSKDTKVHKFVKKIIGIEMLKEVEVEYYSDYVKKD